MTTISDLYPAFPAEGKTDTSAAAAAALREDDCAGRLRGLALDYLRLHPDGLTADECAAGVLESILAIRPRFTELRARGLIVDSGLRRKNDSGRLAIVWIEPRHLKN